MVDQEIVERVTRLPASQRLELIELLTRSLRLELPEPAKVRTDDAVAIVDRLFGILRTNDPAPTDEQIKADYTDYLIQKYS